MDYGHTMDLRPELSIGERLKVARNFANLTQEQLAERAGVNVDTIRKLEQGTRQSARISTVNALAHALGVETSALLLGVASEEERDNPQLLALRRALIPADDFLPSVDHDEEDSAPDVARLRESVSDGWASYHAGDFTTLGHTVPGLLTEARVAVRENTNGAAAEANAVLVKAAQLGAHVLARGRMEDLALHGLDRARVAAARAGDPLLDAMLANSVSWIMMRTGRLDDAERVATRSADAIEPKFRSASRGHVAVYGGLLLSAAAAAGRHQRYDTARELLRVAHAAAQMVGDSTDRWTSVFGPTSVAMQAVQLETAAGEWGTALDLAARVPLTGKTPTSWKAWFLTDVAYAQSQTFRDADAVETLRMVRSIAPSWLRRSGLAKVVVQELLARPRPPRGVIGMARFLGVAH
ncbi:transcriptional regulator [Microbispora rosea subsp. aerata]|nr:transcriptional regulator [Microbispora rosea subsp. aerata]GIH53267.1 transcriptional regulator [Microbispora rosea subsp. aerata]GLJ83819.1 transcriptional regulator [Microbispora rosea subsp. aerata]